MTSRDRYLRRKYKITEAKYNQKLRAQKGVCWFCGKPPKKRRLHVDHNHKTGVVRGLLCFRCNKLVVGRHDLRSARRLLQYMQYFENQGFDEQNT